MDLVVRGRLALPDGRIEPGAFGVEDGRIVRVARELDADSADVIDAGDALVLPGAVDPHVHFRDPGHPDKEDFGSGTTSAAFGGVTAVLDMPNTNPPTLTVDAFEDKLDRARAKAVVDFGLFAGLSAEPTPDFEALLDRATALKTYLGASTGNLLVEDRDVVANAIRACAERDMVAAFHTESEACLRRHRAAYDEAAPDDYAAHARARPPICEAEAIEMLRGLDLPANARVHVCHLSTADGLKEIQGSGFTSEVCPHHLLYTTDDLAARGGRLKMNPPLRDDSDRRTLLEALADGRIDCLASDHAPHTPGEKALDVVGCPAGVPGVETLVPLLLAQALDGALPMARVVEAACRRPAEIYGLPKGRLEPGMDADFAIYDPVDVAPVDAARLHSRAGWSPFEGQPALFPRTVYVRGEPVVDDARLVAQPGQGRFLPGARR